MRNDCVARPSRWALSTLAGFARPAGHIALATLPTRNASGLFDTASGSFSNAPNGLSIGLCSRSGGSTSLHQTNRSNGSLTIAAASRDH